MEGRLRLQSRAGDVIDVKRHTRRGGGATVYRGEKSRWCAVMQSALPRHG